MIVTLNDGTKIECEETPFAEGSEGLLFWDKAGSYVIKLYKDVGPERKAALQKIISSEYSVVLNEPYWDELFAWPKAIIKAPSLGLIMKRAPEGTMELNWFLAPKQRKVVALKHGEQKLGKWTNYLSLAIKMARVVRRMHFRGLCHADLSFRNFLVDPQHNRLVLIDCDGLVVPGFLPSSVLGTPKCMAPELAAQLTSPQKKVEPSWKTDLHALATLIYWLLFQRHPLIGPQIHDQDPTVDEALALGEKALFIEDPSDQSNAIPNLPLPYSVMLTPGVQKLVKRAFVEGLHNPNKRPSAANWERFLVRMTDSLVACANSSCFLGAFVLRPGQPVTCPACNTRLTNPAILPLLHFYQPHRGRQGHFYRDRDYLMVGWPGRTLHLWHAEPSQTPGPGIDHAPKAVFEFDNLREKWYLRNIDLPEIRLLGGLSGSQEISPNKQVELTDGASLLLGPPSQCRLADIHMLSLK